MVKATELEEARLTHQKWKKKNTYLFHFESLETTKTLFSVKQITLKLVKKILNMKYPYTVDEWIE